MPAPCRIVATLVAPTPRALRIDVAVMLRIVSRLNLSCLPSPATSTRGVGILPRVWMSVTSPLLPLISPSRDQAADRAAERLVDCARRPARLLHSIEEVDDDGLGRVLGDIARFHLDLHSHLLMMRPRSGRQNHNQPITGRQNLCHPGRTKLSSRPKRRDLSQHDLRTGTISGTLSSRRNERARPGPRPAG